MLAGMPQGVCVLLSGIFFVWILHDFWWFFSEKFIVDFTLNVYFCPD